MFVDNLIQIMEKLTKNENLNISKSESPDLDSTQNLSSKTSATNLQDSENVVKKRIRRHRSHKFDKVQTRSLIAAVKARPVLWKKRYQSHPSKNDVWQSALEELNIEGLVLSALRQKWWALHKLFKSHSEKLDAAVGHDAVPHKVHWAYFEQLRFLYDDDEDAELDASLEEVSYIKLEPEIEILSSPALKKSHIQVGQQTDCQSFLAAELSEPEIEILSSPALKKSHIQVGQQTDCQSFLAAEPSVICSSTIPLDLTVEESQSNKNMSMQGEQSIGNNSTSTPSQTHCVENHTTTHTLSQQSPETNRTFCNHLSAELRLLSGVRSRDLRLLLMKTMHDFMGSQRD